MKRPTSLALLVALGVAAGCTVGPDWERPETDAPAGLAQGMPVASSGVTAITSEEPWERWWEVFREPQLDQLVKDAREQNQRLRAAFARVQASRALVMQQRAPLFPSASLNGDYRYQRSSRGTIAFSVSRDTKPFRPTDFFQATADLSWEIDLFGRVRRGLEASDHELAATEEDRRALEVSLIGEVADAYFDLGEADASLDLAREIVSTRERSLGLVTDRLGAGVAQELDLRRAEAELESARATLPAAQKRHALAEHRLAILTGRTPDVKFHGKPPAAFAIPPSVPVGLPAKLLERRPDVRAAERRAAAQNALVGQAIASFFPRITLLGSIGQSSFFSDRFFYNGSQLFSIGPSVHLPIFEGGVTYALMLEKEARRDAAVADYRDTILTAFREVADAISSLSADEEVRGRQAAAAKASERALQLAEDQYRNGSTSYITVLDAQRSELAARQALIAAQRDVLRDLVDLEKALGGGWESPEAAVEK